VGAIFELPFHPINVLQHISTSNHTRHVISCSKASKHLQYYGVLLLRIAADVQVAWKYEANESFTQFEINCSVRVSLVALLILLWSCRPYYMQRLVKEGEDIF